MAAGREVLITDLPTELQEPTAQILLICADSWEHHFRRWCDQQLTNGQAAILEPAIPAMETIAITAALTHTSDRKTGVAIPLGWRRNTVTRKIRELAI